MKKVRFLLGVIILSAVVAGCQKEDITPAAPGTGETKSVPVEGTSAIPTGTMEVTYYVTVHFTSEVPLCGAYQVEIVNGANVLMAEAKLWYPSVALYTFKEKVRQKSGFRIARLESASVPDQGTCESDLFTNPDIKNIWFEPEGKYYFDLYPGQMPPIPAE